MQYYEDNLIAAGIRMKHNIISAYQEFDLGPPDLAPSICLDLIESRLKCIEATRVVSRL